MTDCGKKTAPVLFLKPWSERVNKWCEGALFVTMASMTIVTILQIAFRMWFKALTWSEELTCFLLVAASFLGTTVAFKRGTHIAVTALLDVMPSSLKKLFLLGIAAIGIVFFVVVAWYGAILSWQERRQTATAIAISIGWIYLIFPLSGIVIILHLTAQAEELLRSPTKLKEGE